MNGPTSTALVSARSRVEPEKTECGCGSKRSPMAARTKWLLVAVAVLIVAGLALGSSLLGFAAMLPFLFVLPCLVMLGMCMKGSGSGGASNATNAE